MVVTEGLAAYTSQRGPPVPVRVMAPAPDLVKPPVAVSMMAVLGPGSEEATGAFSVILPVTSSTTAPPEAFSPVMVGTGALPLTVVTVVFWLFLMLTLPALLSTAILAKAFPATFRLVVPLDLTASVPAVMPAV